MPKQEQQVKTSFRLPTDVVAQLQKIADTFDRSLDQEIERAVRAFVDASTKPTVIEPEQSLEQIGPQFPVTAGTGIMEMRYCGFQPNDLDAAVNAAALVEAAAGTLSMVHYAFRFHEQSFAPAEIANALAGCTTLLNLAVGINQHHVAREGR